MTNEMQQVEDDIKDIVDDEEFKIENKVIGNTDVDNLGSIGTPKTQKVDIIQIFNNILIEYKTSQEKINMQIRMHYRKLQGGPASKGLYDEIKDFTKLPDYDGLRFTNVVKEFLERSITLEIAYQDLIQTQTDTIKRMIKISNDLINNINDLRDRVDGYDETKLALKEQKIKELQNAIDMRDEQINEYKNIFKEKQILNLERDNVKHIREDVIDEKKTQRFWDFKEKYFGRIMVNGVLDENLLNEFLLGYATYQFPIQWNEFEKIGIEKNLLIRHLRQLEQNGLIKTIDTSARGVLFIAVTR
jgi:hypothetical protein